jgi:hypothetical protein
MGAAAGRSPGNSSSMLLNAYVDRLGLLLAQSGRRPPPSCSTSPVAAVPTSHEPCALPNTAL